MSSYNGGFCESTESIFTHSFFPGLHSQNAGQKGLKLKASTDDGITYSSGKTKESSLIHSNAEKPPDRAIKVNIEQSQMKGGQTEIPGPAGNIGNDALIYNMIYH